MSSNRRLDDKLNIFEGLSRNWYFIEINLITIAGQVLIISFGGSALSVARLSALQWGISVFLGAIAIPVGVIIRLIPSSLLSWEHFPAVRTDYSLLTAGSGDRRFKWDESIESIWSKLAFLKELSRSVLYRLRFNLPHPREFLAVFTRKPKLGTLEGEEPSDERRPLLRAYKIWSGVRADSLSLPP